MACVLLTVQAYAKFLFHAILLCVRCQVPWLHPEFISFNLLLWLICVNWKLNNWFVASKRPLSQSSQFFSLRCGRSSSLFCFSTLKTCQETSRNFDNSLFVKTLSSWEKHETHFGPMQVILGIWGWGNKTLMQNCIPWFRLDETYALPPPMDATPLPTIN